VEVKIRSPQGAYHRLEGRKLTPGILRTCRQFYQEACPILYKNTIFITARPSQLKDLKDRVGERNFSFIRHIVVEIADLENPLYNQVTTEWTMKRCLRMLHNSCHDLRHLVLLLRILVYYTIESSIYGGILKPFPIDEPLALVNGLSHWSFTLGRF
jgi:hypothetical protein